MSISLDKPLQRLEEGLAAIVLAGMVTLSFVNVITRYFLHFSLASSLEVVVNAFVWLTLIGIAIGVREGEEGAHIRFVAATEFLPAIARKLAIAGGFLVVAALFAVLSYLSWQQMLGDIDLEATSPALGLPNWIYSGPTPVLSAWIVVRALMQAWRSLRA